jgi:hypothetical protein
MNINSQFQYEVVTHQVNRKPVPLTTSIIFTNDLKQANSIVKSIKRRHLYSDVMIFCHSALPGCCYENIFKPH